MFLLQAVLPTLKSSDSSSMVVGVVILLLFVGLLFLAGRSSSGGRGARSPGGSRRFSRRTFRRAATQMGLNQVQVRTLENLVRKYDVPSPMTLFSNPTLLDRTLRRAIDEIGMSGANESVRESQRLTIFRIKQAIERNATKAAPIRSTKELKINQALTVSPDKGGRYQSRISANLKDSLGVRIPVDNHNNEVRWAKGARLKVFFWKKNGEGFSFTTKLLAYQSIRGIPSLLLAHSSGVKQEKQRRFRRKYIDRPIYFYPVQVITQGSGRNAVKRAMVEKNRGALGTMKDISAGGCSVRSSYPLQTGSLVKLEFETARGHNVGCYGKVMRTRPSRPAGGQMHIMFTKVTKRNLNEINTFVYEYDE
jgi:hypothetical protein